MSSPITEMGRHGELLTFSLTLNVSEVLPGRKGLSCLTGSTRGLCCNLGYRGGKKKGGSTEGKPILGFILRQDPKKRKEKKGKKKKATQ